MHLKSLTLKGFKSFATPTTFVLEKGVTCVVGPNGSGKSNVVDALAWVMGEQGPKTLRGGKMEDVIFAGTATKGPLGRAEVSLTIDNSDGALPIEYAEVTISRTLFRNGGSEYAINGEPCRLLDVQELLSDTGLGREMHVIVGQGMLDGILKATPEERRGYIEEAAGILKHRRRKEKTERKLEAMKANLTRLNDLAGEVRRQLRPLGQQAETARKAQGIASVVRDAKSRLMAADVVDLINALEETSQSEADRKAERNILQQQLDLNNARLSELEDLQMSSEVETARALAFSFDSVTEKFRSMLTIANQRVTLLEEQGKSNLAVVDPAAIEADAIEAEENVVELAVAVERLRGALREAEENRDQARALLEEFDNKAAVKSKEIADYDARLTALNGEITLAQAKVNSLRGELSRQVEAISESSGRYESALASLRQLEEEHNRTQPSDNSYEAKYEAASKSVSEATAAIEATRDSLHQAERERDALVAKRSALNFTLDQKDGTTELTSAGLRGIRGLLANHMRIDSGYEAAIAAALGSLADAIVADSRDEALSAIDHLKQNNGGRVELVVADIENTIKPADLPNLAGAVNAVDVVTAPNGILATLKNVVIVDDIQAAKLLYSRGQVPANLVVITKAGDVITESIIRGGSAQLSSKVELVAERDSAEAQLSLVNKRIEQLRSELSANRQAEAQAKENAARALAELKRHDGELAANAEQLGKARVQVEALEGEKNRLSSVLGQMNEVIAEAEAQLNLAKANYESFASSERPNLQLGDRTELVAAVEAARSKELDVRVELGSAAERLKVETDRATGLRNQINEALGAIEQAKQQAASRANQLKNARNVLKILPSVISAIEASAQQAKLTLHDLESKRKNQNEELVRLRGETATLINRLSQLTETVHDIELANHEKRLNLGNLVAKANEELGLDQHTLINEYGPEQLIPDPDNPETPKIFDRAEQQKRLHEAERLLDRLGKVNPLALEEFAALEQRHAFLTEQLADLTKTRQDLVQIIKELDEKMQTIFEEAFEDTKKAFEEVFPVLFPGGTGSIYLTDHDNLLTTGIEVNVKPVGKRIERLSLLSGGERSLAALALLFAIFKARPSPFYVLDEVEAALDDANLGRLLNIFNDLKQSSQLVIVTHQKRTMEIADSLYGVSMRQGVSAVIGQRVEESE
ncbi:MAG: chromosome segregation protein SMC [Micrococcales bacterium]|nr:chromosome segregation protein SMC [Micrococcales bacterium]